MSAGLTAGPRYDADSLRIAGLSRFSTVDWPGRLTAALFLQGCPWECFYCHNPELIDPRAEPAVSWAEAQRFLQSRLGLLDGVVFSGGEPTMQVGLRAAIEEVRALGFAIGLHSAGAYPAALSRVLPLVDWIGLDIKARRPDYAAVVGRAGSGEHAWRALDLVLAERARRADSPHQLDVEVRTTVHEAAFDDAELAALGDELASLDVRNWAVQRFRGLGAREPLPRLAERRLHPGNLTSTRTPDWALSR